MRICFSFFLAFLLPLNAAYAAAVSICDAAEHTPSHATHFGHHSYEHGDHDEHETASADADGTDNVPATNAHHDYHDHSHQGFSTLLPSAVFMMTFKGCAPRIAVAVNAFISAQKVSLDRPPKTALA